MFKSFNHIIYTIYTLTYSHIHIFTQTMSLITIYTEQINNVESKYVDIDGNEKLETKQIITYSEVTDQYVKLHIDILGNTYLKHNETYYIVSIDEYIPSGVELTKIKNPNIFRKRLIEENNLKQGMKIGKINNNNTTLRGKASESISNMTDEEKNEHMEQNEYLANDGCCEEKKYFWVKYNDGKEIFDGDDEDDDFDEGFYFNDLVNESDIGVTDVTDVQGIIHSDLLSPVPGSFEVIMIHGDIGSKRVVSSISKIDGYWSAILTVFTSGKLKSNFTYKTILARLCLDSNNEIIVKPIIESDSD